uniref:vesicle-fusing ATPase n=2 Tax=Hirondellea gigas TaxID=1518452 RepID=A0A6A7G1E4_9CRUS
MDKNILEKGIAVIKKATEKDNKEEYQEAFTLYLRGCQYLTTAIKYEQNANLRQMIKQKIGAYLTRCEDLQGHLKESETAEKEEKTSKAASKPSKEASEMREKIKEAIVIKKPNIKWSDVAGLKTAKGMLMEAVIYPIKYPQFFTGKRTPWKGILLYGPPGTGKTFLAKAVATEANNSTFLSISTADLMSKYVGEGEKMVRALFETAREHQPAIIFIDEIEAFASDRESASSSGGSDSAKRMLTEFLVQMDGVGNDSDNLLVLGATNLPWTLDSAIRRRFEKRILIPLPDVEARIAMFKIHIGNTPCELGTQDFVHFGQATEGFSGSDIKNIVRDALYEPLRTMQMATHFRKVENPDNSHPEDWQYIPCSPGHPQAEEHNLPDLPPERMRLLDVSRLDFEKVLQNARPSVSDEDVEKHRVWTDRFGTEGT